MITAAFCPILTLSRTLTKTRDDIMAEFLTTSGVSKHLEDIIKQAKKQLVIISPYLQINDMIKKLLEDKDHQAHTRVESRFSKITAILKNEDTQTGIEIRIVYRKGEHDPYDIKWLQTLNSVRITSLENLHTKCYLNEKEAIITSMNLYQYSQQNNYEMGILVSRSDDRELYEKIKDETIRVLGHSKDINLSAPAEAPTYSEAVASSTQKARASSSRKRKTATSTLERPSTGSCIRCGDSMPEANENKPLCLKDWRFWNESKEDDYPGKFCHFCGKKSKPSKNRPLCINCYRKYKSILEI